MDVEGVRVAAVGFSPYPWNANLNDIPAAEELVRRAAAEADVVVVLMHAGAEGSGEIHTPNGTEYAYGENRGDSRAFAHAVVDAGADLVLGPAHMSSGASSATTSASSPTRWATSPAGTTSA